MSTSPGRAHPRAFGPIAALTALAIPLLGIAIPVSAQAVTTDGDVFISEIHYDNDGTDTGEAIELQAPTGTQLTDWSLVLYDGADGLAYDTREIPNLFVPDAGVWVETFAVDGIQNGPDGIALIDGSGTVIEFLSYDRSIIATDGPAQGLTSTAIGVAETSSTPVGQSLQRIDGVWTGPAVSSFGAINTADDQGEPGDTVDISLLSINDFHGRIEGDGQSAGAAVLSCAVDYFESQNPNTLFVSAGDSIGASTFTSFIQDDQPTIDALNAIGLDVSAFGNHEFD
ncbi:MAG TPA: hypothetical protein VFN24_13750 [Microbacterium sp.]|nr:hypothetical protein [Microbacterium sp.]